MRLNYRSNFTALRTVFIIIFLLSTACIKDTVAQQMAPNFALPDLTGNMVSLKEFRGKVVLVDFWATWCLPCRKTLPELVRLDKKYRDKGLVILGISIDDLNSYDNKYVSDFKDRYKIEYRILRADKKMYQSYLGSENARVPTLFIIDKKGQIVGKHEGFETGTLEKEFQKLL